MAGNEAADIIGGEMYFQSGDDGILLISFQVATVDNIRG